MADKRNLCAMIPADLHARVRQEQEASGKTLSEFVEQLITDYYNMKEGTKMTGDMRTMAIQLPEELFERLQGFPDEWTGIPTASDSARYRALGNSVAVPCVEFIMRSLVKVTATEKAPTDSDRRLRI